MMQASAADLALRLIRFLSCRGAAQDLFGHTGIALDEMKHQQTLHHQLQRLGGLVWLYVVARCMVVPLRVIH